ncbi:MAG: EAL and HDOD domain-containing protein [Methylomonas sp.]
MTDILIGRQQILDSNLSIFAYEILFRGRHFDLNAIDGGTNATNQVITDTLVEIGLNEIVGPHKAFINFTSRNLLEKTPFHLPKDRIVIEVLETVVVDLPIINRLRELSQAGYTIALDDFVLTEEWRPLMEFADIIKLDIMARSLEDTRQLIQQLEPYQLTLLAEKVETRHEFETLKSWGCELFQGFFFSKPNVIEGKRLGINQASAIQLLNVVNKADVCFDDINKVISQDAGLSYKLLRYINSAFFSLTSKIESIQQATVLLGLIELKRWINILMLASLSQKSQAVLQIALIRARMCGLLATELGEDNDRLFLIGMLSCLDSILDMPIDKVLEQLPLSEEIAEAILYRSGKSGEVLQYTINYEQWQLSSDSFYELGPNRIASIYLDSISWATSILNNIDS